MAPLDVEGPGGILEDLARGDRRAVAPVDRGDEVGCRSERIGIDERGDLDVGQRGALGAVDRDRTGRQRLRRRS